MERRDETRLYKAVIEMPPASLTDFSGAPGSSEIYSGENEIGIESELPRPLVADVLDDRLGREDLSIPRRLLDAGALVDLVTQSRYLQAPTGDELTHVEGADPVRRHVFRRSLCGR